MKSLTDHLLATAGDLDTTELTLCAYCGVDLTGDPATAADSAGHAFCDGSHRADYWAEADA